MVIIMLKDKNIIVRMVLFFMILFVLAVIVQLHINKFLRKNQVNLDDGWNISINGEEYENINLSEFHLPATERGTEIIFRRVLPQAKYEQTALRMLVRYSAVFISVDNDLIFEKSMSAYENNQIIGTGYILAKLPTDYAGRKIEIKFITGEKNSFFSLSRISLIDSTFGNRELVLENMITVAIAIFLFVLGFLLLISTGILNGYDKRFNLLMSIGFFSVTIALWMLCNSRLIELISYNFSVNVRIEYISMYLAAFFLIIFEAEFMRKPIYKKVFHGIAIYFVILLAILTYLNESNILHYCKTGTIFHVSAFIAIIPMIIELIIMSRNADMKAEQCVLLGIVFFVLSVTLELIRYRYNKICVPEHELTQSFVPLGTLMFILLMLGAFCIVIMQRAVEDMERKKLYDMAFRDALTNIRNRAWCEKIMHEYEENHKPISIINIDLNYFKHVNDTYGHAKGDELLIQFAEILQNNFPENACVGRMGGDEFIVIMDYENDEQLDSKIEHIKNVVDEHNKKATEEGQISFSYGYSSNENDKELSVWKVYEEADHKMYAYKQQYKMAR